jgi:uncharacterized cupin superfamily protein
MNEAQYPLAVDAALAPARTKPSNYPEPFASRMRGRTIRPLGDLFGLTQFGVNWTSLAPGAVSALRHAHALQDEFVFILEGAPTLITNTGETPMHAGMCAGFRAGSGDAHMLANRTDLPCVYVVIGDRTPGDSAVYPDDDIVATAGEDRVWRFTHKDGTPY